MISREAILSVAAKLKASGVDFNLAIAEILFAIVNKQDELDQK